MRKYIICILVLLLAGCTHPTVDVPQETQKEVIVEDVEIDTAEQEEAPPIEEDTELPPELELEEYGFNETLPALELERMGIEELTLNPLSARTRNGSWLFAYDASMPQEMRYGMWFRPLVSACDEIHIISVARSVSTEVTSPRPGLQTTEGFSIDTTALRSPTGHRDEDEVSAASVSGVLTNLSTSSIIEYESCSVCATGGCYGCVRWKVIVDSEGNTQELIPGLSYTASTKWHDAVDMWNQNSELEISQCR